MGLSITGEDAVYATIALNHKLATKKNIRAAIKEQSRRRGGGVHQSLGEVLCEMNLISPAGHTAVLRASAYKRERRRDKILGRVLVESEYLSQEAVADALREQKAQYARSGQIVKIESTLLRDNGVTAYQLYAAKKIRKLKLG